MRKENAQKAQTNHIGMLFIWKNVCVCKSLCTGIRSKGVKKNISYFNRKDKGPRKTFEQRVKAKEEIQRSKERNIINVFSF